jgi:transcriptional regulator with XRE-family HTH domain
MARRGVNTLQLSRSTGISNSTLSTLLKGSSAMDVDQLARICKALDLEPGPFYSDAIAKADGPNTTAYPRLPRDPRTLLQTLIDNPDIDDELTHRLESTLRHVGDKSARGKQLAQTVRQLRREELEQALAQLQPSTDRASNH